MADDSQETVSSGHGGAAAHRDADAVTTYASPAWAQDNPSPSMERGAGHEVPQSSTLAEEQYRNKTVDLMGVKTENTKPDGREGEMDLPDVGEGNGFNQAPAYSLLKE